MNSKNNLTRWFSLIAMSALVCFILTANANATTITGNLTADNAFFAYISTNDSVLGTLVASGNNWGQTFSLTSFNLTPGVNYYLQIETINYGGPGAFIGQFNLNGTGFTFANGSQTLLTNTTNWLGSYNDGNSNVAAQSWMQPTGGVANLGANGVSPWGTVAGVSGSADWIWANGANSLPGGSACAYCTIDLSTEIYASPVATPEPSSLALLGVGLVSFSLILRKKQQRQN